VNIDGSSLDSILGLGGTLDKGEDNREEAESSLREGDKDALRLSVLLALAVPAVVGWDNDSGVAGVRRTLGFGFDFGFTVAFPLCSGEVELPFSGEERCFPVALYRYLTLFDLRTVVSPNGCEPSSLSERSAPSSERVGESMSCPTKLAEARCAAPRAGSTRSARAGSPCVLVMGRTNTRCGDTISGGILMC